MILFQSSVCVFFFSRFFSHRLKEAQENIKKITAEKRVETKKINANSLVRRDLREAALSRVCAEIDPPPSFRLSTEREAAAEGSRRVF